MKLFLQGIGYLEGIHRNNGFTAHIRLLIREHDVVTDEILLYADITQAKLISLLTELEPKCLKGHTVVLEFCALYQHFKAHFNSMTQEDAINLLTLQGELQSVESWYEECDGMCIEHGTENTVSLNKHAA